MCGDGEPFGMADEHQAPGDEAAAETAPAGDAVCPDCSGSGKQDGEDCPNCEGRGTVTQAVGGA